MKYVLMHGNILEVLPTLPSDSIDLCITSPPYWGLRDYGEEGQLGLEPTMEKYLDNLMRWVKEVWRVLKPTGSFVLNIGDCFLGGGRGTQISDTTIMGKVNASLPKQNLGLIKGGFYKPKQLLSVSSFAYCRIVSETDFVCRGEHIWCKPNVPSPIRSRLKHSHEKLFWFVKDADKYYFDAKAWMKNTTESSKQRGKYVTSGAALADAVPIHKLSGSSCYRAGNTCDQTRQTIEHSWRIVPVGEKQKGFELEGKENVEQFHIAPFPEALIAPYVQSLCPQEVCANCGMPPKAKYERTGHRTEEEEEELKRLVEEKGIPRQTLGLKIPSSGTTKFVGYEYCSCWKPTAGTVLDPFLGSGTTMKLARDYKRNCIGIDLNEKYLGYAKKRLNWNNGVDGNEYEERGV